MIRLFKSPLLFLSGILLVTHLQAESISLNFGEEYDPRTDDHAEGYISGSNLIYDCVAKRWVCVVPVKHTECGATHAEALAANKVVLDCVPGQKFATKRVCNREIMRLIGRGNVPRSCLHPAHRGRLIGFQ